MASGRQTTGTLFEVIAARMGFDSGGSRLPVSTHPLVLFAVGLVVIDVFVLQGYKQLQGYTPTFISNPAWLVQPGFALLAAFGVVYLNDRYRQVLEDIDIEDRTPHPDRFQQLTPYRFTAGLYVIAIGHRVWRAFITPGYEEMLSVGGLSELVGFVFVGLGYNLIYAEFFTTYVLIMVLFPRAIKQSDFKLDFLDPEGLGGLRPVGELAKTAYYFIVTGLVGYLVMVYGPHLLGEFLQTGYPEPGAVTNAGFTLAWLVTIGTMAYGFATLHWYMKRERRNELSRLHRESKRIIENRFSVTEFEVTNEDRFEDLRRRMKYVEETREYPTTFTMWSQILLSLILPKALQLVLVRI